jgi:hypothetical protein
MARYSQKEMIMASMSEEEKRRIENTRKASLGIRNNNLDEGVITFGLWLNAEDKKSPAIPIVMKGFTEGIRAVLQDNNLQKKVIVNIVEGIPFCNECRSNDCAHVGFVICIEQLTNRSKIE